MNGRSWGFNVSEGLEHANRCDLPGSGRSCNKGNTSRTGAAAYPAACSMCCRLRRSGSGFWHTCTTGRTSLTRIWHDVPVLSGMLALACRQGVRQAGPISTGSEVIPGDSAVGGVTPSEGRPR